LTHVRLYSRDLFGKEKSAADRRAFEMLDQNKILSGRN
jgi:hypothetical protein